MNFSTIFSTFITALVSMKLKCKIDFEFENRTVFFLKFLWLEICPKHENLIRMKLQDVGRFNQL